MSTPPRVSIVVPVRNGARFLARALESLAAHDYPDLEVIVQDGGSTDGSLQLVQQAIARDPGRFRLFAEEDTGMGDALNRGFARASGEILGCLGANDVLLAGALSAAASRIAPSSGRCVVAGGSLLVLEGFEEYPISRPAGFLDRFELLAIWGRRFKGIAFPGLFWHKSVSQAVGPFIDAPPYVVDYDFACRIAGRHSIEVVDEPWSATHLHGDSASARSTDVAMLQEWIAISRRHWGPWLSPLWWRCAASHWRFENEWHEKARHHARRAEAAARNRQRLLARIERLRTYLRSPEMGRNRFGSRYRRWLECE